MLRTSWLLALSCTALLATSPLVGCGDDTTPQTPEATGDSTGDPSGAPETTTASTTDVADSTGDVEMDTGSCTPLPANTMPASLDNGLGTLHGTLMTPEACPPFDVVLMHVGSGATDRDGNSAATDNDSHLLLAEALQQAGIATLRYDKRGVAQSSGAIQTDVTELRFEDYVTDLELWMEALRADEAFGTLTVLGHSEGALIATIASQSTSPDRLIALAGAGRRASDVLREQLSGVLDRVLLDEALAIIDELEQGNTVDDVSPELLSIFTPAVQPYLISWFAYDPADELAALRIPTLVSIGTTDVQIPLSDAERLVEARPDAQLCIIEGMNHVLKEATLDPESQAQTYEDPTLPIVPELIDCVVDFVLEDAR